MALSNKSVFNYGIQVTEFNRSLDFKAVISDSTPRQANLNLGFYSIAGLAREVERALTELDTLHTYTVTVDRTILGGTENRMTIASSNSFFQMLFSSGPRVATSCAPLLGFPAVDQTGATSYTGNSTIGTRLEPYSRFPGYNYLGPEKNKKVFGNVNISASGLKEAVVFNIQKFFQVEFKYEPDAFVQSDWVPFMEWAIQQRPLEFTPDISDPNTFYEATLEKTEADGKGLAFMFKEMLPQFPGFYRTGLLTFRQRNE